MRLDLLRRPWVIASAGAVLALVTASLLRGRVHPDEVYQVLEPANRLAFGFWRITWEWQQGLRNWAVPGVLAGLFRVLSTFGIRQPWALAAATAALCASVQALGTVALYRLVEERDGGDAAVLAAWVQATCGGWLIFAARPIGDALSVAPLLGALLFAWRAHRTDSAGDGLRAGLLLGAAFVIRYPSAVFGLPVAICLVLGRRWRALGATVAGGLMVVGALALLDFVTWGHWLQSAVKHTAFNVLGGSESFGSSPWWSYALAFGGMAPVLLLWHFVVGLRRRDLLVWAFAGYLGALLLLPHKEPRFLVPLLPLFVAIAAGPAARDLARLYAARGRVPVVALVLSQAAASIVVVILPPIGLYRQELDAWVRMGQDPNLRGLVSSVPWHQIGGTFYLGHDVPMTFTDGMPLPQIRDHLADPVVTHVLVRKEEIPGAELERAGFRIWESGGRLAVWRRAPR